MSCPTSGLGFINRGRFGVGWVMCDTTRPNMGLPEGFAVVLE